MKFASFIVSGCCALLSFTAAGAAASELATQSRALQRASDAVVGLTAKAIEDARSSATLGAQRQGSGVVIGSDGLVLTIGYLILEAEDVEIATDDGPVVLKLVKPCARCSIPDVDPASGEKGHAVQDALSAYRADARVNGGLTFGMNAIIVSGIERTLRVGAAVRATLAF